MRKQTPTLDWNFAESEAEWEDQRLRFLPDVAPVTSRRQDGMYSLWLVMMFLVLAGAIGWRSHTTEAGLQVAEVKRCTAMVQEPLVAIAPGVPVTATVWSDLTHADWRPQYGWGDSGLRVPLEAINSTAHLDRALQRVESVREQPCR